jgi:hypothetical protein
LKQENEQEKEEDFITKGGWLERLIKTNKIKEEKYGH